MALRPQHRRSLVVSCLFSLLSLGFTTQSHAQTVFVGDNTIENEVDSAARGTAEAFQATATTTGQISYINVFLDSTSTSTKLVMGVYADSSGHPGSLLSQGSSTTLVASDWNAIPITPITATSGTHYWIAILGTLSGTPAFRDVASGSCNAESSSQTSLTSLPSSWSRASTLYCTLQKLDTCQV
jgi:hypothetical protein